MSNRYKLRGVSSDKEDVHEAIKTHDKGLFPKAFCKILPDYVGNSDQHGLIVPPMEQVQNLLCIYILKETGDYSVWKGIAKILL